MANLGLYMVDRIEGPHQCLKSVHRIERGGWHDERASHIVRLMFSSFITTGIVLVAVGYSIPCWAEERLNLNLSPQVAVSPTELRIQARVTPNAENRVLEIIAESLDFYRSS